jgi:hypothetical protein
MKRRRKRNVKNDYNVRLAEDGHNSDYEMETYLEIGVSRICA